MRKLLFLLLTVLASPAITAQQTTPAPAQVSTQNVTTGANQPIEQGHYVNSDGQLIHSPAHTASGAAPSGATAQCRDGSYSFSQHRRGTCSHHGGVADWL